MKGMESLFESVNLNMLKFFTVQSNLFVGIVSFIFLLQEYKLLKGKIKSIDKKYYLWKLVSTTSVGLTFLVVFAYLGPVSSVGLIAMIGNSNLFFHLIIPVLSMITFVFFEGTREINNKEIFYGIIPTIVYGIYYFTNIIIHMENGRVSGEYDFYWFVQGGVWTAIIVVPIMLLITYLICFFLWILNRKLNKE